MRIYVTGIGVLSAIGNQLEENLHSLRLGQSGIQASDVYGLLLGTVHLSNETLVKQLQLPPEDYSRSSLLALKAAKECWGANRLEPSIRTGLISATSIGGLDRMEEYYFRMKKDPGFDGRSRMIHDNGYTTEHVARALGISGYIGTISTACSSGANAIMQGARLIKAKKLDRVLVGGVDPLTLFNVKGFGSLMIYDSEPCKPFDEDRKGLNMGEGAGFLLLENEDSLSRTGNTPLCEISGWQNATDAYHQTASSPTGIGATLTMQGALTMAGIRADQVSYINAHGTGTGNNDLSESSALKNVFGDQVPPFSSTKSFTGHTLAAAGAIEAVYSVLAILSQALWPNLNFSKPMPETGLIPVSKYTPNTRVEYVLSNSFGFGGNCTSLLFKKYG